ncbi:MAG: twin-arginine translocation signal domain-containing protein, partial [Bacteroidales bacterium]|nr:twin-arginine translocation signal domain-containing protein [Bacteroidales bacterium]
MDRRNFIGLTAAAAAGLALPSGLVKAGAKPVKRKAGDYS